MTLFWAETVVLGLGIYFGVGAFFALYFVSLGAGRIDPDARGMPLQARLMIFTASMFLWPYLAIRVLFKLEPPVR